MADFEITAALEGQTFPWESKKVSTSGGKIVFWLHAPTQLEVAMAHTWAGLVYDEKGEARFDGVHHQIILNSEGPAKIHKHLAALCIDRVDGFDRWPQDCRESVSDTLSRLTKEAIDALKLGPSRSTILLEEIGEHLLSLYLDDAKKKSSEPPSTGPDSENSTPNDTPTTAQNAQILISEEPGSVTADRARSMISEGKERAPAPSL